jgi:hypothetical protein
VVGVSASADGQLFASIAEDGTAKMFDVINFGGASSLCSQILGLCKGYRHDQHGQIRVHTTRMLLDSPTWTSTGTSCSVSSILLVAIVVC